MKKFLFLLLVVITSSLKSQVLFEENFDTAGSPYTGNGFTQSNQSAPVGASTWLVPATASGAFASAYNGTAASLCLVNFNSTTGTGTISNWLFSPEITVQNGDVVTYYTRKGGDNSGTVFPDNLQFRMSSGTHTAPSGVADVGSYTTLINEVNPTLTAAGYPFTWTLYTHTISGLTAATPVKFAFRYYVTNGGPNGANSDIIAIDAFKVERPVAGVEDINANQTQLTIYPNPVKESFQVRISEEFNTAKTILTITDLSGKVVKTLPYSESYAVSDLAKGVYMLTITDGTRIESKKLIKE